MSSLSRFWGGAFGLGDSVGLRILNGLPHLGHLARLPSAVVGTLSLAPQSQRTVMVDVGAVAIVAFPYFEECHPDNVNDLNGAMIVRNGLILCG